MSSDVTLVVTSCGRPDLLERTLSSFAARNTAPLAAAVVIEDSGTPGIIDPLRAKFPWVTWIENPQRQGQVVSIDTAYATVATPYIFHCEDDWEFLAPHFIERSKEVLLADSRIITVWLRGPQDTNTHPLEPEVFTTPSGLPYRLLATQYCRIWHGFTWNPGLRRQADWARLGRFGNHVKYNPSVAAEAESVIGHIYFKQGMRAASLLDRYVSHIGWGRHVE